MKFEFLENVAIADIAFRAHGKSKEELFENCALALCSVMADLKKIKKTLKRKISVSGKDDKELLYNFLEEIVYLKDVDGVLFNSVKVKFSANKMDARCTGGKIEKLSRKALLNDIKAITMHMFDVKTENKKWIATVVVDI